MAKELVRTADHICARVDFSLARDTQHVTRDHQQQLTHVSRMETRVLDQLREQHRRTLDSYAQHMTSNITPSTTTTHILMSQRDQLYEFTREQEDMIQTLKKKNHERYQQLQTQKDQIARLECEEKEMLQVTQHSTFHNLPARLTCFVQVLFMSCLYHVMLCPCPRYVSQFVKLKPVLSC